MSEYNPYAWFWVAEDGRVFDSARAVIITDKAKAYKDWVAAGMVATNWPRDDSGNQTDAALQDVLRPYGIWVDIVQYAADKRWRVETGGTSLGGLTILTDDRSKLLMNGAYNAAKADPEWSTKLICSDGSRQFVQAAQMIAIGEAIEAHVNSTFVAYSDVIDAIEAGTITDRAGVDAWPWPPNG